MNLPEVSFVIPTYNAGKYIERCLRSIVSQGYPEKAIEIVVIDGGSTDDTLEICERFNLRLLNNPEKLAEIGQALGIKAARGDLIVAFAADNALPTSDWLLHMIRPFQEHPELAAAFSLPIADRKDSAMNRYYCDIKTDPLTFFVFNSFGNRLRTYKPLIREDEYDIFIFPKDDCPLVALAQGFVLRKEFVPSSIGLDDVAPFCDMVSRRLPIAMVRSVGIYHYHLEGLSSFIRKYVFRARTRLLRSVRREGIMNLKARRRMKLWLLYSLSWIFPLVDSVKGYKEDPNLAWFYHPLACFVLCLIDICVGVADARKTLGHFK